MLKNKFLFLFIALFLVSFTSAAWYNPFTWGSGNVVEKTNGTWVETFNDNPDFYYVIPDKAKHDADIYLCSKTATKKSELKDLDFATSFNAEQKDMKSKAKLKPIKYNGAFCYYYKPAKDEKFLKFDKHSTHFIYTTESITAYDDTSFFNDNYIEIGKLSLTTEGYDYKNGKPNIETSRGTDKLTHTFYIENYTDKAITNLRAVDLNINQEVNRNTNLKFLTYVEVLENTYDTTCENVINGTNITEICTPFINGTILINKEQWNDMSLAVEGENYLVGVFADVLKNDYVDIDFDYYGTSIMESPIDWATWTESLNTDLVSYYKMDDISGTITDALGNYDGTNIGASYSATGKINNAMDFEFSESDYITSSFSDGLSGRTLTYNAWVKLESLGTYKTVAGTFKTDNTVNFFIDDGNVLRANIRRPVSPAWFSAIGSTTLTTETWYMVTLRKNETATEVLLNGVADGVVATDFDSGENFNWLDTIGAILAAETTPNNEMDGLIDELGIWNRYLTNDEITALYNNNDPPYLNETGGEAPTVTLTTPLNESELTSGNIDFSFTATDDLQIDNVTINLDGVANLTVTTGVNGSYTETINNIAEGYHNWSVTAIDNQSLSTTSDTWFFNYTQPPVFVELLNPTAGITTNNVSVNVSCWGYAPTGVTELNLTINAALNETLTNSTPSENLTIEGYKDFIDGTYNWSCSTTDGSASASSSTRMFTVDTTPFIDYITPPTLVNNSNISQENIPIEVNVSTLYFANITYTLENEDNGTVYTQFYTNETYSINFTNFPDAHYDYNVTVCATTGQCNTTETRHLNHDATLPVINITSPVDAYDYLIQGDALDLNWTVTDASLDSCKYYYNNTRIGTIPYNVSHNDEWWYGGESTGAGFIDGDFGIFEYMWGSSDFDIIMTTSTLLGGQTNTTIPITDSCMLTDGRYEFKVELDGTDLNFYCYNGIWDLLSTKASHVNVYNFNVNGIDGYLQEPEVINCSLNTTTFNYIQGLNSIIFYANDTFGNFENETQSWVTLIGSISQTYDAEVYEGDLTNIAMTATLSSGASLTAAKLSYGGTNYTTSITFSGGSYIISSNIAAPSVTTDTNYTFGFYLTIDGTEYFPISANQTVLNAEIGTCDGTNNVTMLTMNLYDEETRVAMLGDIEISVDIIAKTSLESIGTANLSFTNVTNGSVCLTPLTAYNLYYFDGEIRYTSEGFTSELYYIQDADLADYPANLSLFDLNLNDSTEFLVKYQDDNLVTVADAIIQLQRKYIAANTFEVVEAPLTSNIGTAVVHIDLNTNIYNAIVVKDGVVLDIFNNIVFDCENELSGICTQNLFGAVNPQNTIAVETLKDFTYAVTESGSTLTVTYSIPSGSPGTVNVVLLQTDMFGETTTCNQTIFSGSGSIDCSYNATIGDSFVDLIVYKGGVLQSTQSYIIPEAGGIDWLDTNFFLVFILIVTIVGMAYSSPEFMVINAVIAMVFAGGVWLVNGLNFVVGLGTLLWLIIAAIILIYKMTKQEDR